MERYIEGRVLGIEDGAIFNAKKKETIIAVVSPLGIGCFRNNINVYLYEEVNQYFWEIQKKIRRSKRNILKLSETYIGFNSNLNFENDIFKVKKIMNVTNAIVKKDGLILRIKDSNQRNIRQTINKSMNREGIYYSGFCVI